MLGFEQYDEKISRAELDVWNHSYLERSIPQYSSISSMKTATSSPESYATACTRQNDMLMSNQITTLAFQQLSTECYGIGP